MKKLILVICMMCTAGIAEASSKRNDYYARNNAHAAQTIIATSLGVLQIRPGASLVNIVVVNTPKAKVRHVQKQPVVQVVKVQKYKIVRKKDQNRHSSHKSKNHRTNVRYSPYYYD